MYREIDSAVIAPDLAHGDLILAPGEDNTIQGWRITLRGALECKGHTLKIIADTIIFEEGSSIDASGDAGTPLIPKPLTPAALAQNGTPGLPGPNGSDGGNVTLIAQNITGLVDVDVTGGMGGKGQAGGDGSTYHYINARTDAAGGRAGAAGPPGLSGAGGSVKITSNSSDSFTHNIKFEGGEPCPPAEAGFDGGYYERSFYQDTTPPSWSLGRFIAPRQGPQGAPGVKGVVGHFAFNAVQSTSDLASQYSIGQYRKVLAVAESQFINDDVDQAIPRLAWLSSFAGVGGVDSPALDATAGKSLFEDDILLGMPEDGASIQRRAEILGRQIVHGNGYFGLVRNFVPLYGIDAILTSLNTLFDLSIQSESVLVPTVLDPAAYQANMATLRQQAIDLSTALITTLRTNVEVYATQATFLEALTDSLIIDCNSQLAKVLLFQSIFNEAVAEATDPTCSLDEIAKVVGCIIAVVSAVYTAGASVVAATSAFADGAVTLFEGVEIGAGLVTVVEPIYKKFVAAEGDVTDVIQKYNALRDALAADAGPDAGRIVMAQKDFENLHADFDAKVDAAPVDQSYKDDFKNAVHMYVQLILWRNQKIAEYDAAILKIIELDSEIKIQKANKDDLQDLQAVTADPEGVKYASAVKQILAKNRSSLRFLVWLEKRALGCWELADLTPDYLKTECEILTGNSAASLLVSHNQLALNFASQQFSGGIPFAMNPAQTVAISLSRADQATLASDGQFSFEITPEQFPANLAAIYVTSVTVEFLGLNHFVGKLTHSGRQLFLRPSGDERVYSTVRIDIPLQLSGSPVEISLTGAVDGDDKYKVISPFTIWTLRSSAGATAALANLTEVKLTFRGRCVARL